MSATAAMWLGPDVAEARAAFARAREAGLSSLRALVVGQIASFRDCFAFRKTLAAKVGCSIRTVQRALTQAVGEGLMGKGRAKPGERTPGDPENGGGKVLPCGWSHRWIIGRGKAGAEAFQAVQAAKARWMVRHSMPPAPPAPKPSDAPARPTGRPSRPEVQRRRWTAEELDAELERLDRNKAGVPPPD